MREKEHIKRYLAEKDFVDIGSDEYPDFATERHEELVRTYDIEYHMRMIEDQTPGPLDTKKYYVLIGSRTWRFAYLNHRHIHDEWLERVVRRAVVENDPKQSSIISFLMSQQSKRSEMR